MLIRYVHQLVLVDNMAIRLVVNAKFVITIFIMVKNVWKFVLLVHLQILKQNNANNAPILVRCAIV